MFSIIQRLEARMFVIQFFKLLFKYYRPIYNTAANIITSVVFKSYWKIYFQNQTLNPQLIGITQECVRFIELTLCENRNVMKILYYKKLCNTASLILNYKLEFEYVVNCKCESVLPTRYLQNKSKLLPNVTYGVHNWRTYNFFNGGRRIAPYKYLNSNTFFCKQVFRTSLLLYKCLTPNLKSTNGDFVFHEQPSGQAIKNSNFISRIKTLNPFYKWNCMNYQQM
ncbi:Hypothetical_protein [Hexamita inflata]|uniref:Hypothetical_protein n=1 Tax=Hexamita inflata TaxID=28002 RepID=A0AA86QZA8_9EUKA|nr:Hypothetical protein HINF_LOCUS55025 [Hexamita inflata]